MSYLDILRQQLPIDEGERSKPYRDSVGKLTIGIGRNLDDVGLHDDEIAYLLENDLKVADRAARRLVPTFETLSEERKAVVVNMTFNMGERTFGTFTATLHAIQMGDFDKAADAMLASKWAQQVGTRARRLADLMRGESA